MKYLLFFLLSFLVFIFLYSAHNHAANHPLYIGSKRFTESYILGEILKQLAAQTEEALIDYRPGLGNTGIVYTALRQGLIDVYPEYTGTIIYEILKLPLHSHLTLTELNEHLQPLGLAVSESLGFQNNYALAMQEQKAEELGIRTLSDLAAHPALKLGFSQEFLGRLDGWEGLKRSDYHFPPFHVLGIDHSLSYEALAQGKIDVTDIYSTDPKVDKYRLRVLEDDHHFFPHYEAVLFYRLEAAEQFPLIWKAFQDHLVNQISNSAIIALNTQAELEGKSFSTLADEFLHPHSSKANSLQNFWTRLFGPDSWTLTKQHLFLVFGALFPAIVVGIALGVLATYWPLARHPILNVVGMIQTFPALALLAFLIPVFKEIGTVPALAALFLYSLLPIVRNTYTELSNISSSLRDSALSLGLPFSSRLYTIELPLASRTILAGIKTAAVLNVGMATIAAFIGAGGFGERIVAGLALNDYPMLLSGAIPVCALAVCIQLGFDALDYYLIPKGLHI